MTLYSYQYRNPADIVKFQREIEARKERTKNMQRARIAYQRWAIWRRSGKPGRELDFPSVSLTGKFLDNMPGIVCPACVGRKINCPICHGAGKIRLDKVNSRINPAFIKQTGQYDHNALMCEIDRYVCELRKDPLRQKYYFVLWAEFVYSAMREKQRETQEEKAKRMGITHDYYRKLLQMGLELTERSITSGPCRKEFHDLIGERVSA